MVHFPSSCWKLKGGGQYRPLFLTRRIAADDFLRLPRSMTARLTLLSRIGLCIVITIRVHLGADGSGTCHCLAVRLSADSLACYLMSHMPGVPVSTATQSRMAISVVCNLQLIFLKALLFMPRLRHKLVPVLPMSFKHGSRSFLEPRSHMCHSMYADPSLLRPDTRCQEWRGCPESPAVP